MVIPRPITQNPEKPITLTFLRGNGVVEKKTEK
jgi:hypothetical protein